MIEKYLIERKDIVLKQIEKINLKIEHNSNVLEENTKKIKELEYIDDEAANIFSVKVRKEEFYKQKEASSYPFPPYYLRHKQRAPKAELFILILLFLV